MSVKPIPDGFRTVQPHLVTSNAAEAMEFYAKAFDAEECLRIPGPGGSLMHGELKIGDSMIMIAQEMPEMGSKAPTTLGGTGCYISLYVEDCDAAYQRAIDAGCTPTFPLTDMFWGDRYGQLADPYGHVWEISTHTEDLSPAEIAERMAAQFGGGAG
jgi:PhnB protein